MKTAGRSLIKSLVALALLGGLLLYAKYGVVEKKEQEQKDKELKAKMFPDLTTDQVVKLELITRAESLALQRDKAGSPWRIARGASTVDADQANAGRIADDLVKLSSTRLVDEKPGGLEVFGLSTPFVRVIATNGAGQAFTLTVGDKNTFNGEYFAMTSAASGTVFSVPGSAGTDFNKTLFDLREKNINQFDKEQVRKIDLKVGEAETIALLKDGKEWKITAPRALDADTTAVEGLLNSLNTVKATSFVREAAPEVLTDWGLDAPTVTASIYLGEGMAKQTLRLRRHAPPGGTATKYYALREGYPPIVEVADSAIKNLEKNLFDLRDKKIFDTGKDDIAKIEARLATGNYTVAKEQTPKKDEGKEGAATAAEVKWNLTDPPWGLAKTYKVNSMLYALTNLKTKEFPDEGVSPDMSKYGFEPPTGEVKAYDAAGTLVLHLLIGAAKDGENTYVRDATQEQVFVVENYRVTDLPKNAKELADKPPEEPAATPPAAAAPAATGGN